MSSKFKVGSLFAGVGGICLGFQQAKNEEACYEVVWANEIDQYACETYRNNFQHKLIEGDIRKVLNPSFVDDEIENLQKRITELENEIATVASDSFAPADIAEDAHQSEVDEEILEETDSPVQKKKSDILKEKDELQKKLNDLIENRDNNFDYYTKIHPDILAERIDILNGGFPCQAFSIAGGQKGFEDDRGILFLSIIELINQLDKIHGKPRILLLENVKNLKSHDKGQTYKVIKSELEKVGYTIKETVLNTMDFTDLPQNRERIYIAGFLNKEDADKFTFFDNVKKSVVKKTSQQRAEDVKKIIDYDSDSKTLSKYYYTKEKYPIYFVSEEDFDKDNKKETAVRINLAEQVDEMHQFYQVRRGQYVRKNKSDVCPTLTANMGTGGHNVPLVKVKDGVRKLTPCETFKLQGFPIGDGYELPQKYNGKEYADSHLYKQAGNAVSVPMIRMLAEKILAIIS
ncbi:DNA (cytosine-5-)-methyltransferase [Anaerosporobacter sp.]|uniref:DNA (cytosine-5-)-methyltransferase n=1 Tax=Anaerosporobacter sp. TaxID=1872529 RepID=UPI00286ECC95|nr:DNA (cytosine-5-)-methyltransferase [Anaerosporobacter sp.]